MGSETGSLLGKPVDLAGLPCTHFNYTNAAVRLTVREEEEENVQAYVTVGGGRCAGSSRGEVSRQRAAVSLHEVPGDGGGGRGSRLARPPQCRR